MKRLLVGPEHAHSAREARRANQTAPPRPIRVVHVLEELQLAGMETGVIKVVNRLPASIEATICCLRRQAEVTKPAVDPRVRVLELGRGASHDYGVVATLARLFRRERAQVVHSHNWQTYLYSVLAARLAGVPVIVHGEHGHDGLPVAPPASGPAGAGAPRHALRHGLRGSRPRAAHRLASGRGRDPRDRNGVDLARSTRGRMEGTYDASWGSPPRTTSWSAWAASAA